MSNRSLPYVTLLKPSQYKQLRDDLISQGFELNNLAYAEFQGTKKGVTCTLYSSGKLVVQGKEAHQFIEYYLEPELLKVIHFGYENLSLDRTPRIGIDEAGKGDFFGPLCIAGVYAAEKDIDFLHNLGVKDSKTFKDPAIHKMAAEIKKNVAYHIIRISPKKYNEIYPKFANLNRLLAWGHASAIEVLYHSTGCHVARIDQFTHLPLVEQNLKSKKLPIDFSKKTHGESDIVIAAASILARDGFVKGLEKLSEWLEMELPKGASKEVLKKGKELLREKGESIFNEIAKTHFKTMQNILN